MPTTMSYFTKKKMDAPHRTVAIDEKLMRLSNDDFNFCIYYMYNADNELRFLTIFFLQIIRPCIWTLLKSAYNGDVCYNYAIIVMNLSYTWARGRDNG